MTLFDAFSNVLPDAEIVVPLGANFDGTAPAGAPVALNAAFTGVLPANENRHWRRRLPGCTGE